MLENNNQITSNELRTKDNFEFAQIDSTIHDTKFETKPVSYIQDCLNRFVKNKASVVAAIIIAIITIFAVFEPICDPKTYAASQFTNGEFADVKFAGALPKLLPTGTGFWDGTEEKTMGQSAYELSLLNDSNYQRVYYVSDVERTEGSYIKDKERKYTVRIDTYAVGCFNVDLSQEEFEELKQHEETAGYWGKNEKGSIMKPLVDYHAYLKSYREELNAKAEEWNLNTTSINNIIDKMELRYQNNSAYFFALEPEVTYKNGRYNISDTKFNARYLDEDKTQIMDIYKKDTDGEIMFYEVINGRYTVRVDYYDYFTYKYDVEPIFVFGANLQGKDILLRLALGCRFSLLLGLCITLINFVIGLIWGAISGYYGGRADLIMERFTDIISNIPTIIIMSIANIQFVTNAELKATLGPAGIVIAAILIAFVYNGWVGVAATTRMQFYRFKGQEYVLASRTLGASDSRLIFKHILPNATGTLVTRSVLMIPSIIFSEASLSYLGIIDFEGSGIYSIGSMINEGKVAGIQNYPHVLLFPSIIISLLMISFNLFGNGLRDAFNTTLRGSED